MVRIKPRYSTPGVSPYVIKDSKTGEVHYRVPPDCIHWPQEFRLRIVRDWFGSGTMSAQEAEAYTRYMTVTPFTVQRIGVQFFVKLADAGQRNGRVRVDTLLYADGHETAVSLYHASPQVRSLMVYSYLTGEHIGGMPKLRYVEEFR